MKRLKSLGMPASLATIILLVLASRSPADAPAEGPAPAKVQGVIKIVQSKGRDILEATLTSADGKVYQLVLDEKGEDLAKVMFGQGVKVVGQISQKDGKQLLKVLGLQDEKDTAAYELWRRTRCNACAVENGMKYSVAPKDLHGAVPITGRLFPLKVKIQSFAKDDRFLWLATDTEILQVDLAKRQLVRTYGKKDGLPDPAVYQVASDGKTLWIVHHGGVAAMTIGEGRIVPLPDLKCSFARVFAGSGAAWIIADTGTYQFKNVVDAPKVYPALPTGARITKIIGDGLWMPQWQRDTAVFITTPACAAERLHVGSFGDVYELADGAWKKIAPRAWEIAAQSDRVWMLSPEGLVEYDPRTGQSQTHSPPDISQGRFTGLVMTGNAAWVTAEPKPLPDDKGFVGGGLARFDLGTKQWKVWQTLNEFKADHISCLKVQEDEVWAVSLDGRYETKSAHPGMTYVEQKSFVTTGFGLHHYRAQDGTWESFPLKMTVFDHRLICGQDGGSGADDIVPQVASDLTASAGRIFVTTRLYPRKYFSGYWSCVEQIASREGTDKPWNVQFDHHPEQLNLQGEQPLCLNISNKGVMVLEAVGHDEVLGQFLYEGTHWTVTESCAGWFDEAKAQWQKAAETGFRFYWKATAALDNGKQLYIGSDRGLVSRLDFETGRFEFLGALKDRSISRICRNAAGEVLIASKPAPIGMLPVQLRDKFEAVDCDVAKLGAKGLEKAQDSDLPPPEKNAGWSVMPVGPERQDLSGFLRDKSVGNFLWGPVEGAAEPKPRFYVKEAFTPQFLCTSADGRRIWLSTFTGLLRLEPGPKEAAR